MGVSNRRPHGHFKRVIWSDDSEIHAWARQYRFSVGVVKLIQASTEVNGTTPAIQPFRELNIWCVTSLLNSNINNAAAAHYTLVMH